MTKKNKNKGQNSSNNNVNLPAPTIAENDEIKILEKPKEIIEIATKSAPVVVLKEKVVSDDKVEVPVKNEDSGNTISKKKKNNKNADGEIKASPPSIPDCKIEKPTTTKVTAIAGNEEDLATSKKNKKKKSKKAKGNEKPEEKVKEVIDPVLTEELKQKRIEARKLKKKIKKLNQLNRTIEQKLENQVLEKSAEPSTELSAGNQTKLQEGTNVYKVIPEKSNTEKDGKSGNAQKKNENNNLKAKGADSQSVNLEKPVVETPKSPTISATDENKTKDTSRQISTEKPKPEVVNKIDVKKEEKPTENQKGHSIESKTEIIEGTPTKTTSPSPQVSPKTKNNTAQAPSKAEKKSPSKTPEPKPKLEKPLPKKKPDTAKSASLKSEETVKPEIQTVPVQSVPVVQTLNKISKDVIKNENQNTIEAPNKVISVEVAAAAITSTPTNSNEKIATPITKNQEIEQTSVVAELEKKESVDLTSKPSVTNDLEIKTMIESIEKAVSKTVEVLQSNIDEKKQQQIEIVKTPVVTSSQSQSKIENEIKLPQEVQPVVLSEQHKNTVVAAVTEIAKVEIEKVDPAPLKPKEIQKPELMSKVEKGKLVKGNKKQINTKDKSNDGKMSPSPKNAVGSDFVPFVNNETKGVKSLTQSAAKSDKANVCIEDKVNKDASNLKEQMETGSKNKSIELPEINPQTKIDCIQFESEVLIDILDASMSAQSTVEINPSVNKSQSSSNKNNTSTPAAESSVVSEGKKNNRSLPKTPENSSNAKSTTEKTVPTSVRPISQKKVSPPRTATATKPDIPPKPENLKKLAQESKKPSVKSQTPGTSARSSVKPEVPHKPDHLKTPKGNPSKVNSKPAANNDVKSSPVAGNENHPATVISYNNRTRNKITSNQSDFRSKKTELNDAIKAFIMKNMDIPDLLPHSSNFPSTPKQYSSETQLKLLEALVGKNLELNTKSENEARKKDKIVDVSQSSPGTSTQNIPPTGSRSLLTKDQIKILLPFAEALQAELKKPKLKTNLSSDKNIPESNFLKLSAVQDSMANKKSIFINEEDDDNSDGEDEEEYLEYKFAPRQVFLSTVCQICKTPLKEYVICKKCEMISYCSEEHKLSDLQNHNSLCSVIQELAKKRGGHIYNMAKKLTDHEYRNIRVHTLNLCQNMLERSLQPFEREIILFPRICYDSTCREWHPELLVECKDCKQVSYCKEYPDHLQPSHKKWCKAFLLYQQLVLRQKILGRIEPVLPARILQKQLQLPNAINEVFRNMYKNITAIKDQCNYATLTQIATAPLTALKSYQQYLAYCNKSIQTKIDTFTIHLIGAELQFEGDTLDKWESFFLHLVPEIMELRVVFVGPELNVENLPIDIISRIRMCRTCRQSCRAVKFDFQCKKFYHDYCGSSNFTKPDLLCFYNPGLHRSTGYNGFDSWPKTIKSATSQGVPIAVTAYTELEAPLDLDRIKKESTHDLTIVQEPTINPYASQRPERNFISDEIAPMIFKNYYYFVVY